MAQTKPSAPAAQLPAIKDSIPNIPMGRQGIAFNGFNDLFAFCKQVHASGACQESDTPASIMVKIQMGQELGITPMTAMQSMYVVNRKVSMEVDLMKALVLRSGEALYVDEGVEGNGMQAYGWARTHRKGEEAEKSITFTMQDAQIADLLRKDNWRKYPKDMLPKRALSRILKRVYPDIVKGAWTVDEAEDYRPDPIQTDARVLPEGTSSMDRLTAQLRGAPPPPPAVEQTPAAEPLSPVLEEDGTARPGSPAPGKFTPREQTILNSCGESLRLAKSAGDLDEVRKSFNSIKDELGSDAWKYLVDMFQIRKAELAEVVAKP